MTVSQAPDCISESHTVFRIVPPDRSGGYYILFRFMERRGSSRNVRGVYLVNLYAFCSDRACKQVLKFPVTTV